MKKLGKTDMILSPVGLGADSFSASSSEKDAFKILDAYID